MSLLAIAVIGVLSVWLLMIAIVQLPFARCRRVRRLDPVGHLLPGWNFFAPKPVRADFAVWFRSWTDYDWGRDDLAECDATSWTELAGIGERRLTDGLINPGRFPRKSIFTCCNRIVTTARLPGLGPDPATGLPSDAVLVGLPYLVLLTKVAFLSPSAVAVQFRIDVVRYEGTKPHPHTVFRSAVHRSVPERSDHGAAA